MVVALLFWLGIAGLVMDWRYMKSGGVRPTREEKRYLAYAVALSVGAIVVLALLGGSAAGLGNMAGLLMSFIVFLWSARRYMVRRRARRVAREMTATDR